MDMLISTQASRHCYTTTMNAMDGRNLAHHPLEETRFRAVRHVEAGERPETAMRLLHPAHSSFLLGIYNKTD